MRFDLNPSYFAQLLADHRFTDFNSFEKQLFLLISEQPHRQCFTTESPSNTRALLVNCIL